MTDVTPTYVPAGNELAVFRAAYEDCVPLMLTGPTGCGKTRFVEHMAATLGRSLVTVTCHDELTTADLVGRYLVRGGDVDWIDGPLTNAVRTGAICYLDEVIEARRDTLAILHSLCDHRRTLFLERTGEALTAPPNFMLVCSYNPRARGAFKELKPSFRQRFVTLGLDYLEPDAETVVVAAEGGVSTEIARLLVTQADAMRQATSDQIGEPPSTRLLIVTAGLIKRGLDPTEAIEVGMLRPMGASASAEHALRELLHAAN